MEDPEHDDAQVRAQDRRSGLKRNLHAGGARSRGLSVSVFTESELDDIHLATLEILERTGVFVEDDEALDIFKDGGCRIDRETRMVRIPPHVVEDAIASSPSRYTLCGRDPKNDVVMEPGRVAFTNFSEGIRVIDTETGEYRQSTKQDIADIARLNDYLSEMDTHEIAVGAKDVPPETAAVHNTEAQLLNTTKPIGVGPLSGMECRAILRMCAEIVGGEDALRERPIVYGGVCPVSPLQLPRDATEVIIESCALVDPRQHPQYGDGRRLEPGHPGRHAGDAQRRGAQRHRAGAAHGARLPRDVRQFDDGDGPQARRRVGGLARDRRDQRRGGGDGAALPDPQLRGRVVGRFQAR